MYDGGEALLAITSNGSTKLLARRRTEAVYWSLLGEDAVALLTVFQESPSYPSSRGRYVFSSPLYLVYHKTLCN